MPQLSPEGEKAVADMAQRTGFGPDAVMAMLLAVLAGRGQMAQFSHREFGGSGQWMAGGAIMLSDMFNNALKARVDALCSELSALVLRDSDVLAGGSFQSQSQGDAGRPVYGVASSLLTPEASGPARWWPADLGAPASVGAQNAARYAYFPQARRLVIDLNGKVTVYDTQDHRIGGFSQQQSGTGSLTFTSQFGTVEVARLPVVFGEAERPAPATRPVEPAPAPAARHPDPAAPALRPAERSEAATGGHEDILNAIERLANFHARGILTEAEFTAKKAELLSRL